jgi:CubicO group peptidase (beta-lactamase class C family)
MRTADLAGHAARGQSSHRDIGHENGRYAPHGPDDDYEVTQLVSPGGGVHMSVDDLARFAALHLRGLRGIDGLVSASTVRRMHQPVGGNESSIGGNQYALGWFLDPATFREPRHWHNGMSGIFRAMVWIFPDRNLALVAAGNADTDDVGSVYNHRLSNDRRAVIASEQPAPPPSPTP